MAHIDFAFYNEKDVNHEKEFKDQLRKKCPGNLGNLEECIKEGIEVSKMEFFTYGLFEDFNHSHPDYSSYSGFHQNALDRERELEKLWEVKSTIAFKYPGATKQQICYSGCGIALLVSNKIFGLTNADYIRIDEKPGRPRKGATLGENKTLDFEYFGSDSERILRVECKGKSGVDGSIVSKANDIKAKKNAQGESKRDINFGIIAVVPILPESEYAKAILVDPEIPDEPLDPFVFRVYSRLYFYSRRLSNLGRTGWVEKTKSLIEQRFNTSKIRPTEKVSQLVGVSGRRPIVSSLYYRSSIIEVGNKRVICQLVTLTEHKSLLYGFVDELINTLAYKNIEDLLEFSQIRKSYEWDGVISVWDGYSKRSMSFEGEIEILPTGEVLGILSLSHGKQN